EWRHGRLPAERKDRLHRGPDGIAAGLHGRRAVRRVGRDARGVEEDGVGDGPPRPRRAVQGQSPHHGISGLPDGFDEAGRRAPSARPDGRADSAAGGPDEIQVVVPADSGAGRRRPRRAAAVSVDGRQRKEVTAMADDSVPKSAYELAMERLRKKDEADGVTSTPVTDEQKTAIAEVRN